MDSVDQEVLRSAVDWLTAGQRVTLVTVSRTWGSSPRAIGAMLAVRGDGCAVGSVSGGCIEDELIQELRAAPGAQAPPRVVCYGVDADQARRFGLPCGGTVELVIETLDQADTLAEVLAQLDQGRLVARELQLASGVARLRAAQAEEQPRRDAGMMTNVFGPRYRLLLIGAGQLAGFVARIALSLDYQVVVCDPRAEHADAWAVPATTLVRAMPDDAVLQLKPDARTAVLTLTHDPRLDDLALIEALRSPAFHVGALGSRATSQRRRERLAGLGLKPGQLARLRAPVGLPIGSRSVPEIAISILAELTAARNRVLTADGAPALAADPGPVAS